MFYRELKSKQANAVMEYCEQNNLDYDIWNAEQLFTMENTVVEIGVDWEKIPQELGREPC